MDSTAIKQEINGIDLAGLHQLIKSVRQEPALGEARFRITNRWRGADENRTTVGGFYAGGREQQHVRKFVFDCGEPQALLGQDNGANPVEFLLHALAGCVTTATVMHAAAHGIRIRRIETGIEGDLDMQGLLGLSKTVPSGYRQIRMTMRIESDAEGEKLEVLKQLHGFSPVLDTLRRPVDVQVDIQTEAGGAQ